MRNVRRRGHPVRYAVALGGLLAGFALLGARAVFLQAFNAEYLQGQGNARHLRVVEDNSHRGMILDRNDEPLAVSTPVDSVWAHPGELGAERAKWPALARALGMPVRDLAQLVSRHAGREFMYLRRHVTPDTAERIRALGVAGVALTREYRRYYPAGEVAGHVIGFTNIDDQGQEGLELAYDSWLRAIPGKKRVLKDRFGNIVETVESVSLPVPGKDLVLSLDRRIQYLAYRELKAAVAEHGARGGSAIVLDARTGEILALANEPGFNPNNRSRLDSQRFRNRAVTDVFEPGSTLKPFTVAAALESGKYAPDTPIDTAPGLLRVGHNTVRDIRNHGRLTVAEVIEKSSNVGASKIAFGMGKQALWAMFRDVGFGAGTGIGLPGEASGQLSPPGRWVPIEQATVSFGYGISVTALQLAHAYAALANDGVLVPLTLTRRDQPVKGDPVMSVTTARQVRAMLELAVSADGTGSAARVPHYRIAGKTGTVHKLSGGSYAENNYIASFAGFAPASDPRLVMMVMIDDPSGSAYFGGQIAAPVFSRVMAGALRLLNISPDDLERPRQHLVGLPPPERPL
ncbi:MAG TPA: penicillin-binding protein 2 [Acidiferrobacterales bacterium]